MSKGLEKEKAEATLSSTSLEAIKEELTCSICLDVLVRPCVTACGHNFCRRCLRRALRHNPACPDCREPIQLPGHTLRVNTRLWNAVQMLFPETSDAPSSPLHEECTPDAQPGTRDVHQAPGQPPTSSILQLPSLQSHARRMRSEFEQLQDAFYSAHRAVRQRMSDTYRESTFRELREAIMTPQAPLSSSAPMWGPTRPPHSSRTLQQSYSYPQHADLAAVPFGSHVNQVASAAPRPYLPGLQGRPMTRTDAPSSGPPALYPSMGNSSMPPPLQQPPSNPMMVMGAPHPTFLTTALPYASQSMGSGMGTLPPPLPAPPMMNSRSPGNPSPLPVPGQLLQPRPAMPPALPPGSAAAASHAPSGVFLQDLWMEGVQQLSMLLQGTESNPDPLVQVLPFPTSNAWPPLPPEAILDDIPPLPLPPASIAGLHEPSMYLPTPGGSAGSVGHPPSRQSSVGSLGLMMGMQSMPRPGHDYGLQPPSVPVDLHPDDGQGSWNPWTSGQSSGMRRTGSSPLSLVQPAYWLPIAD